MVLSFVDHTEGIDWQQLTDDLIADQFSNGRTPDQLRRSFENSAVVAFAKDDTGRVVAKGRALSDGVCNAYIVDIWTHSSYRRQGVATRIMQMLLSQLNGQHVYLFTDDSQAFYKKLGFAPHDTGMGRVVGEWLQS